MSDIELVINIPEEKLSMIKNEMYCGIYDAELYKAIVNGTLLPKGHGDLIDSSYEVSTDGRTVYDVCGYLAPTIIEADEVESEG